MFKTRVGTVDALLLELGCGTPESCDLDHMSATF
jgi:hypothetical protein